MSNASTAPSFGNSSKISYFQGDLTADNFDFGDRLASFANKKIVISGNGNLEYGNKSYDTLDFSSFSVDNVTEFSLAEINSGGEVVSFQNGDRVFDSLTLSNGSQILFEGIDRIVFSDKTVDLTITPDDPKYSQQWNLHMMGVQNAWRFTTGTEEVLIGIQDSGLGVTENQIHPDLRIDYYQGNNIADDFLNNIQGDSYGVRDDSHGTSVQGIIAAESDNDEGIAGINWNSEVYQIDVLNKNDNDRDFIEATQDMIDIAEEEDRRLVINLSLGEETFDIAGQSAVDLEKFVVTNPNVLFVIAAGNQGHLGQTGLDSPAILARYYDNVIAVGASWGSEDINGNPVTPGTRIEYEQAWGSQYGQGLTVTAPSEVLTTEAFRNGDFGYSDEEGSVFFNGTSAAAPHVSGVASLIWSANPDLTAYEVKDIISETAFDLGEEDYDLEYGYGFINADAAVRGAIALGREDNNTGNFSDRFKEMLENFQERFPNVDLSKFYDIYGLNPNSATELYYDNNNIDPLTGGNSDSLTTLDFESLDVDNFDAIDSNSVDFQLIEESGSYNLGINTTDTLNYNEVVDIIGSANNGFLNGVVDGSLDIFNSTEVFL